MNFKKHLLLLGLLIAFASSSVSGDEAEDKAVCVSKSKSLLKKVMKLYSACNKELGMSKKTPQEFHDLLGCSIKCVMKKLEVLGDDDLISESMIKEHVEKLIPAANQKHAHEGLMKCVKLHDSLDSKDPTCKTYQKLGNCMQDALTDICGVMPVI